MNEIVLEFDNGFVINFTACFSLFVCLFVYSCASCRGSSVGRCLWCPLTFACVSDLGGSSKCQISGNAQLMEVRSNMCAHTPLVEVRVNMCTHHR